ncbi:hypothetical protein M422DRAFT_27571 [Sphaerobolus stellatus SS14]|nr:hypothetical protein M422DRAFT_27571 [Sphaerobolus stellatus SS14]
MSSKLDAYLLYPSSTATPLQSVNPSALWSSTRPKNTVGETKLFYGVGGGEGGGALVGITSVGDKDKFAKKGEEGRREDVRKAVGSGVRALRDAGARSVGIDVSVGGGHDSAVAATLGLYKFTTLRTKEDDKNPKVDIAPLEESGAGADAGGLSWKTGLVYGQAQNIARELMELPANIITPTNFCTRVQDLFKDIPDAVVYVRDEAWAKEKGMGSFLSVTKGTDEPAKFLEIHYNGHPDPQSQPLAFVGKGVTFDSGGISLKPGKDMKAMRADMGGAATVVASLHAIAKLRIPINAVASIPLTENLPGPSANKPGDIVYAMNGKTIEIDNTDAEGRLILADALYYTTSTYKPHTLVDVATLTGAIQIALGEVYSGVFCNSDSLWSELHTAGEAEHDRLWRMPLDEEFGPQIRGSNADLCNIGGPSGGSCTAALFLKEFVDGVEATEEGAEPSVRWAHIDIGGTMEAYPYSAGPYTPVGMTGRPTRALIEFARRLAKEVN